MTAGPIIASPEDYGARLGDPAFWSPYLAEILTRHGLADASLTPVAGIGGTYPTFLYGDLVVKLFGYLPSWDRSHVAERAVQAALAGDPEILAPRLLAEGQLYDEPEIPWPYLITTRMPGLTWDRAGLSRTQRLSLARQLGEQIRRVHALRPSDVARHEDWPVASVAAAAAESSLPPPLVAQVDGYLAALGPFDRAFVHGDLMHRHVFVDGGHLAGIIDWGDALVTDRHYELAKLHLDLFDCDKALLRAFLRASRWPLAADFAQKAMAQALYRQAHGLVQHPTMDVFYKLPDLAPLEDINSLDALADKLFAVDLG